MNERLKELMIESGAYDYYEINEGVAGDEQPMIKLVELVVKECASMCEREGYRLSMDDTIEHHRDLAKQCHKIGLMLAEHFGVE